MSPETISNLLVALATPRRVAILKLLLEAKSPVGPSVISALVGMGEGPTSYNLSKLTKVGLVTRHNSGRMVFFQANRPVVQQLIRYWRTKPNGDTK